MANAPTFPIATKEAPVSRAAYEAYCLAKLPLDRAAGVPGMAPHHDKATAAVFATLALAADRSKGIIAGGRDALTDPYFAREFVA